MKHNSFQQLQNINDVKTTCMYDVLTMSLIEDSTTYQQRDNNKKFFGQMLKQNIKIVVEIISLNPHY